MLLPLWVSALSCGIAAAILCPAGVALAVAAVAVLPAAWSLRHRRWTTGVMALAVLAGVGLGRRELASIENPGVDVVQDRAVVVVGEVVRGPDAVEARDEVLGALPDLVGAPASEGRRTARGRHPGGALPAKKARLLVRAHSADGASLDANIWLAVAAGVPEVSPGDEVSFVSRLHAPDGLANAELADARLLARARGIDLVAPVASAREVRRTRTRALSAVNPRRLAFALRQRMAQVIDQRLDETSAAFVRTMVLGERTGVPARVEDGFRAAGATHALSVSGLHLAVVAALVFGAFRRLASIVPSWALRANTAAIAAGLALPVVAFYALLTGEAVATMRSAFMAALALGAALLNRPFSLASSIALAALVLLLGSPLLLVDVSFQLSFASVIALGLFARRLTMAGFGGGGERRRPVLAWLGSSLAASFAASLITAPFVAYHFGEVTPAAPIGNLALVPIVELVVLPCGLVGALLALAHPWAGALPLVAAGLASHVTLAIAEAFRQAAPVLLVRMPNLLETAALLAGASFLLAGLAGEGSARRCWLAATLAMALVAFGSLAMRDVLRRSSRDLRVTFVDVGQGDAALVEGPAGFVALVDGGGRYDNTFDTGARVLEPLLRRRGIGRIDLMILSHAHPDHINGLLRVLARFEVGALWSNGAGRENPVYSQLLRLAGMRNVSTPAPLAMRTDAGLHVAPLGPWVGDVIGLPPGLDANNASLIVRVSYAGRSVLLTGDIGIDGEAELVARGEVGLTLAGDVIKVPHHGSHTSSSTDLLRAVKPRLAVISVGRRNGFRLPNPATLSRYSELGIPVLRTDRDGAITLIIDRAGQVSATCARGCR